MPLDFDPDAGAAPIDAEALYRAHASFVASFLRHMGAQESDLDDHVQDVFVIAHRKGGYKPGPAAPRTWLASIAFRVVLGRRRTRARRPEAALPIETLTDEARGPAELLETQRSLARVQAALDHLSLEHRAAFVLHEIEGESCESIAAMWEVPIGTVYSRLHHGRKRFLEVYGRSLAREKTGRRGER
ncbi:MAG TPA: RNA polymerase sigma factor [Polyangiales bacterium]|nr:RNA polymerase sigma factor [Polyangiales bacterium]